MLHLVDGLSGHDDLSNDGVMIGVGGPGNLQLPVISAVAIGVQVVVAAAAVDALLLPRHTDFPDRM